MLKAMKSTWVEFTPKVKVSILSDTIFRVSQEPTILLVLLSIGAYNDPVKVTDVSFELARLQVKF